MRQNVRPHEIIVFDDASDAVDVGAFLRSSGLENVRVLRSDEQGGVGPGRNVLLQAAAGDVFFFLDDDAWLEGVDILSRLQDALDTHPAAGIIAARIVDHRFAQPRDLVPFPRHARRKHPDIAQRPQLVSYFLGGAHAIRREVFERIGGYDEGFVWGEEELDLSFRAIQAGYEIFYAPDLVVQHDPMASVLESATRPRREVYYHVRNRLLIARKYLPVTYVTPYLGIWLVRYLGTALANGAIADFFLGIASGARIARSRVRVPLGGAALSYLRRHHGRLLF